MEQIAIAFFCGMVYVDVVVKSPEVGANVGHLFLIVVWHQKQGKRKMINENLRPQGNTPSMW
jgi:hypothetical protein